MRCDTCVTLNSEYRRVDLLMRIARGGGSGKKVDPMLGEKLALDCQYRANTRRREALLNLCPEFKTRRKQQAAKLSKRLHKHVDPLSVPIEQVVPDYCVESQAYCDLANKGMPKAMKERLLDPPKNGWNHKNKPTTVNTYDITPAHLIMAEMMDLDEQSGEAYAQGYMHEDLSLGPRDPSDDVDGSDDGSDCDSEQVPDDEDDFPIESLGDGTSVDWEKMQAYLKRIRKSGGHLTSRRLLMLTALEKLVTLRRFHHDHIV